MAKRRIVAVVSQKGGVGKSTLCQLIAREAAASGNQVKILDFDVRQMSSTDWVRARLELNVEPVIAAEPIKNLDKALKHSKDYDVLVLDGMPGSPKLTAELAAASRLIVLPTGASRADLVPTLALARRLAEANRNGQELVFALCRVMTATEAAEARGVITDSGFAVLDGELIERPGYRQAQNAGRSLTETSFGSLNSKARRLVRGVLERIV
jgi:chromosome partitioning protein